MTDPGSLHQFGDEQAKAVQEVAKTTGKAVDASREFGGFLDRIFGAALGELGGMGADRAKFWRAKQAMRLMRRFEEFRARLDGPVKPVPLNFGIPLLEAASLQENDEVQEMFARLLSNATDPNGKVEARRAFVSILQDFGPLEARLLHMVYHAPAEGKTGAGAVITHNLPDGYASREVDRPPRDEVQIALWNLCRQGCLGPAGTWGGGTSISVVTLTGLGRALIEACTNPDERVRDAPTQPPADMYWGIKTNPAGHL
jgi:hypothetical protein